MNTKQLRQKILNLAISGKLVPQDPADEPASVLLERIAKEKAQLIKEGKIKADKTVKTTSASSDRSHYQGVDIPVSWAQVRLEGLGEVGSSKRVFTTELVENGVPFYRGTEIGALAENKPIKRSLFISEEHYQELIRDSDYPAIGDLLMPSICPDGRIWLVDTDEPFYFKDGRVLWVHFDTEQIDKKYIHIALKTMLIKTFSDIASGSTFAELKIFILKDIEIPLPPLAEQSRIAAAIESAFALIDEIERNKFDLTIAVTSTKQKILSLAVSGNLVPQDSADEPASVLLDRIKSEREQLIKAGKIKADKKQKAVEVTRDNSHYGKLPYELPESWNWYKLSEFWDLLSGRDLTPSEYTDSITEIPYITGASNFTHDGLIINRWTSCPKVIAKNSDLLVTCKGTVGAMRINTQGEIHIARQIMAIRNSINLNVEFLQIVLESFIVKITLAAKGIIPGISREDLLDLLIPCPPLNEQNRIANAVSEANTTLTNIAKNLN